LSIENKQIEDLMYQYMKNTDKEARFRIIDALSEYESKGIDAINELLKVTGSDEIVLYGMGIIKKQGNS
jgi:hypothetical protein